jgi:hypothetical protein
VPAPLTSLIDVPRDDLSAALAGEPSRLCLREWLLPVPDPRKRAGRWHPLEFVLALAVCAFTAAGHDSPTAIAGWAAGCSRESLLVLGGRPDPLTGRVRPPSTRTFRRVFARISADALNQALYGFLEVMPPAPPGELPEVARREREQRRAAAAAREVDTKTNEIPELLPMLEQLDLDGMSSRPTHCTGSGKPPGKSARTSARTTFCSSRQTSRPSWTPSPPR